MRLSTTSSLLSPSPYGSKPPTPGAVSLSKVPLVFYSNPDVFDEEDADFSGKDHIALYRVAN